MKMSQVTEKKHTSEHVRTPPGPRKQLRPLRVSSNFLQCILDGQNCRKKVTGVKGWGSF